MPVTTTVTRTIQEMTPAGSTPVTVTQTHKESGGASATITRTFNQPVPPGVRNVTSTMTITDN
jgi:hypothetical protein